VLNWFYNASSALVTSTRAMNWVAVLFGLCVLALLTFGIVMLSSTSAFYAWHTRGGDSFFFARRQAVWMGLGLAAAVGTAWFDYRHYRKLAWALLILAALLLGGLLIFGHPIKGAIRWYVFGPVRFQPSELAKYALVILLAHWLDLAQRRPKGVLEPRVRHWWWGVWGPLSLAGGLGALILKEPDLGTTVLLGMVTLVLLWLAGASGRWLGLIVGTGIAAMAAFLVAVFQFEMFHDYYQVERIVRWWYEDDLEGINYQQWMAMVALGSGGVEGFGLGDSRMKMAYLPEAHTDFIFPIIGEELGLIASLAVVAVFCLLIVSGLLLSARAPDSFGRYLGCGIMTTLGLQTMINMAVVTNLIPNKGMPLPFISYGGSNLVMTLAALGIVMNIARLGLAQADPSGAVSSQTRSKGGKPPPPRANPARGE
jgi:cell division protein FtsW